MKSPELQKFDLRAGLAVRVAVFLARVIHDAVLRKVVAEAARSVCASSVMTWLSRARFSRTIGMMFSFVALSTWKLTGATAALNERQDGVLVADQPRLVSKPSLRADEGLVNLDYVEPSPPMGAETRRRA